MLPELQKSAGTEKRVFSDVADVLQAHRDGLKDIWPFAASSIASETTLRIAV